MEGLLISIVIRGVEERRLFDVLQSYLRTVPEERRAYYFYPT